MESFIHTENIRLYQKLLAETSDPDKRKTILKLLADEEAKDGNSIGPAGKLPNAPKAAPSM
ncbi:MAG TPA: hypothetical protein VHQ48_02865 [Bradyrhizobium sp.]|jgi:hypothetical protein|nr:hypothetical protein [Bradyrhizobium sp.]